jgi:beta-lactamase class D
MKAVGLVFSLFLSFSLWAADTGGSQKLAELFRHAEVEGTFVLHDVSAGTFVIHNRERAEHRYIPASTFKIPNSLIGLSTGAVESVDEILPYGGKPQYLKIWEQDMGLREAIRISNVPIYQELARRIGLQRMSEQVRLLGYGNGTVGEQVDQFWLQGPLEISAMEQVRFLARLAQGELPLPRSAQDAVREIILVDEGEDWVLFAKTGWSAATSPAIGWWIGWVEKDRQVFTFALNIDMRGDADANKRKQLGYSGLEALDIIKTGEKNAGH